MEEIWKTISICPKYEVSNLGNIRNAKNKKIRQPFLSDKNKLLIDLNKKCNIRNVSVARLVYNAFADEPAPNDCKVIVIDKNPLNCRFDNLRLRAGYGLIPTHQQLEIFNQQVYACVKYILFKIKNIKPNTIFWGGLQTNDLIQDCVTRIYEVLPVYDFKVEFLTFCWRIINKWHICNKYIIENQNERNQAMLYIENLM